MRIRNLSILATVAINFIGCAGTKHGDTVNTTTPAVTQTTGATIGKTTPYTDVTTNPWVNTPAQNTTIIPVTQPVIVPVTQPVVVQQPTVITMQTLPPAITNMQYGDRCAAAFINQGIPLPLNIVGKTIHVGVNVLGIGSSPSDMYTTAYPVLTVIVDVNVLSSQTLLLLNRNAYYCVVNTVNVLSQMIYQRACSAQITGVDVGVNVLSQSNMTDGVSVNVLSQAEELPCAI